MKASAVTSWRGSKKWSQHASLAKKARERHVRERTACEQQIRAMGAGRVSMGPGGGASSFVAVVAVRSRGPLGHHR